MKLHLSDGREITSVQTYSVRTLERPVEFDRSVMKFKDVRSVAELFAGDKSAEVEEMFDLESRGK